MRPARPLPPVSYPAELPIAARRDEIVAALRAHRVLVVCGETGSGKTTQLPKMLLEAGALRAGLIGHTQPRRIAARAVAARLAAELPAAPPGFVGYKVRFSDGTAPATAIKVMTDGILLAEARTDRELRRYDALIIDEAHERSLNIDFLLGLLKRLLPRRPELKLVITSATIDPARFADYFGGAPVIEVSGRGYPVETRYRPLAADADDPVDPGLTAGILAALEEIATEPGGIGDGDVLVFLPGEREIREAAEAIEQAYGTRLAVLPLYSRLAWSDQQRVFERRGTRRVVLATNVAETSLTVPGIRAVIDSGLARLAHYSARAKILRLPIEPVSQASARQRAGRCGRVGAGLCIRLYGADDHDARAPFTPPEVLRTNLANVILQMEVLGLGSPAEFPFLDPPDTRLVNDGYRLLQELEAVDGEQRVTAAGRQMARLPVDPRLARMLVAATRHGALKETLTLTAALSIQDPRERPAERLAAADAAHAEGADPRSDFMTLLALWGRYQEARATRSRSALRRWCAAAFLSAARMREWEDLESQLATIAEELGWRPNAAPAPAEAVHRALLAGLLGQIGEKTERGDYLGPRGRRFLIAPGTPLRNRAPRWLMAAQIVETQRVYARTVAAIEPAWIEAAAAHLVRRDYAEPEWDATRGIVSARESVTLWGLTLAAGRRVNYGAVAPAAAREIFVREALVHGRTRLKARFLGHNAALKDEIRAEEAALRRRTLLIDESEEAALYLARLPAGVCSLAAFERWRGEAERSAPQLLWLSRAELRRAGEPPLDRARFPAALEIAGNRLPLEYRFDPESPADGATLLVPEPLLARLAAGELDWGVPGWLEEKLTALIRGLPKAARRRLVPAPDVARRCLAALGTAGARPLLPAVAEFLTREGGEAVSAEALAAVALPPYLSLNLRVLDADGRTVAEGRDPAALRRARRGARPPPPSAADPWRRDEVRRFDFGVLPETVRVERQGVTLDLHPALRDCGTHAALSLEADAAAAAAITRRGLLRLLALELAQPLRHAEKLLGADRELLLLHQPVGPAAPFVRALAERALERACLPEPVAAPRDAAAFAAAAERGRPVLVAAAERLAGTVKAALAEARLVRGALAALPAGLDAVRVADLRDEFATLLYPGFVAATPDPWLDGLGRYLKALGRRAAKLGEPRRAVAEAQAEYQAARRRYAALGARLEPGEPWPAPLAELGWLLREYGVQLFAQELRTRVPVSAKRIAEAFAAAEGALAAR
ncbi:MAG TPA: ATP-dependent RNA helicase HrpA [Steroidobacteraceae bacterium]|nr:ATP-dependent RNA helicase HrpA [Steroidobacteraceae bacterium]